MPYGPGGLFTSMMPWSLLILFMQGEMVWVDFVGVAHSDPVLHGLTRVIPVYLQE